MYIIICVIFFIIFFAISNIFRTFVGDMYFMGGLMRYDTPASFQIMLTPMTCTFTPEDRFSELTEDTYTLLDAIDKFVYPILNPTYNTLGELHNTLAEVRIVHDAGTKRQIVRMTLGEIKSLKDEWEKHNDEIRRHNDNIYAQMQDCQDDFQRTFLRSKLIPDSKYKYTGTLQKTLDNHTGDLDTTEVDVKFTYQLGGFYSRTTTTPTKGYVVLKKLGSSRRDMLSVATTYIHELMHAFYDADLSTPMNDAEYTEEPLAEYGTLRFVQAFVKTNPLYRDMLQFAIEKVTDKQQSPGIAHYGFGAYLHKMYAHIDWEHLMRDAHSKINNAAAPYTDLQNMLDGIYPDAAHLPSVAQKLHDVLTTANGTSVLPISASPISGVGRITPATGYILLMTFRVAGMCYSDADGVPRAHDIRSLAIGDELILQRDPTNSYDDNAILLIRQDGRELGFIPRTDNAVPAAMMDNGMEDRLVAVISDIQPEGHFRDRYVEVNLWIG